MAVIRVKRSSTPGKVPASLQDGEIAVNQADGILYWRDANGVIQSTPLFSAPIDTMRSNNIIINGGMEVSQRYGTAAQNIAGGGYIADQWYAGFVHTGAVFSGYQNASGGPGGGLPCYFGLKATTPISTAVAAADYALLLTKIEGYRWSRLAYGSANAMPITVGFWVYASVSGTGTLAIRNNDNSRSFVQDFTVTGAQWNWVVINVPGDQAGTWLATNGIGATLAWTFACGSAYKAPTNNAWVAGNFLATTNTTNFFGTANNYVGLTGVCVVPGTFALPSSRSAQFIPSYDRTLDDCLRYYERGSQFLSYRNVPTGITYAYDTIPFIKSKRAGPSITMTGWQYYANGTPTAFTPTLYGTNSTFFAFLGSGLSNWMGWYTGGTWAADASL